MVRSLKKKIAEQPSLNRNQRRILGKRSSLHQLMRESGTTWGRVRADYGDFPVSDEMISSRILERFMKGECSDHEFEARMNGWISDPAEFSKIAYDYKDMPNMIDSIFGDSIDRIENAMREVSLAVENVARFNKNNLEIRSKLRELRIHKHRARSLTTQYQFPPIAFGEIIPELEKLVGTGRAGHFAHYFQRANRLGFAFKRSDVMDVVQMCYTYECDLFRCDKAMAATFKDYEPFQGKLVARFSELPQKIAAQVEKAKASKM